ncbi:wsv499 [White spot syndrome virus]|uniref:Wsv499 n=2 Tax=White spot syndrome virus TaxID=92652 RepID=Q8VAC6_WSSVS|nr:wsv499 [Shrimp white spot syndrome virus]AAL33500.1 wsv499 [Shrimp white spot syndrome virus]AAL88892.1 WSSV024 [Shrimp white spot syndrome virus]
MKILMSVPVTSLTISISSLSPGGTAKVILLPLVREKSLVLKWFRTLSLIHIGASDPVMDMIKRGLRSPTSLFLYSGEETYLIPSSVAE